MRSELKWSGVCTAAPYAAFEQVAVAAHEAEHQVAAFARPIRIAVGIEITWTLHDTREEGRLGGIELREILIEIRPRAFGEPADGEGIAPAQIDLIGVVFQNLLLREPALHVQRDDQLFKLALPAFPGLQPKAAGQLHTDRGRSLIFAAGAQIDVRCFDDAPQVKPGMLKKTLVFHRDQRMHQVGRDVGVADQAPPLATAGEIGNQLRPHIVLRQFAAIG